MPPGVPANASFEGPRKRSKEEPNGRSGLWTGASIANFSPGSGGTGESNIRSCCRCVVAALTFSSCQSHNSLPSDDDSFKLEDIPSPDGQIAPPAVPSSWEDRRCMIEDTREELRQRQEQIERLEKDAEILLGQWSSFGSDYRRSVANVRAVQSHIERLEARLEDLLSGVREYDLAGTE